MVDVRASEGRMKMKTHLKTNNKVECWKFEKHMGQAEKGLRKHSNVIKQQKTYSKIGG